MYVCMYVCKVNTFRLRSVWLLSVDKILTTLLDHYLQNMERKEKLCYNLEFAYQESFNCLRWRRLRSILSAI